MKVNLTTQELYDLTAALGEAISNQESLLPDHEAQVMVGVYRELQAKLEALAGGTDAFEPCVEADSTRARWGHD